MKKILLALFLVISVSLPVYASPSILVLIPSTDIQPKDQMHLNYDTFFNKDSNTGYYGLEFGLGNNTEIGFDYMSPGGNHPWLFNAKVKLGNIGHKMPVVAGVYNVGTSSDTNQEVKYLLTSYTDDNKYRYTLGYGVGRKEALPEDNRIFMAGIDKAFNDKWWASVDYQSGNSVLGAVSVGVAYNLTPKASLMFGYNFYNSDDIKNTATIGLDINF